MEELTLCLATFRRIFRLANKNICQNVYSKHLTKSYIINNLSENVFAFKTGQDILQYYTSKGYTLGGSVVSWEIHKICHLKMCFEYQL